jgi:F-type H+-transporting ATPase subunit epsilon
MSFVGVDNSGSFAIRANHARMMTCLKFGLSKIIYADEAVEYLALTGGVLYFVNNELFISTRKYFRSKNYDEIENAFTTTLHAEEAVAQNLRKIMKNLDEKILKRLWELGELEHL